MAGRAWQACRPSTLGWADVTDNESIAGLAGPPPPVRGSRARGSMAKIAGWAFAIYAASAVMRFGFQVGYARMLGVEDFGRLAVALSWALLLAPVATLGYSSTVLALVPVYGAREQWSHIRGLLRRARMLTVGVGIAISVVAALFVLTTERGPSRLPFLIGFALVPILGLLLLHQEVLRAFREPLVGYTLALLAQPALAMAMTALAYVVIDDLTAAQALFAYGLSGALIVAIEWRLVARIRGRERAKAPPEYEIQRWTATSRGLFVASMFQRVIYQADLVLVGIMLGPRDAGLYAAASRIAGVSSLIVEAVNSIAAPDIAHHHASGDREALQRTVDAGVRLTFWPALAAFGVTVLFADPLLALFGEPYTAASGVLILLAAGGLVNAATGPCGYLLSLTGHEATAARIAGVHAVANLVVAVVLIELLGRNGGALASALVFASFNITVAVTVRRRLGVASYPRRSST
jgi:O-antigen/teichoic acid export membrane protein